MIFYIAYFSAIRDFNVLTVFIPLGILAIKYIYLQSIFKVLSPDYPSTASKSLVNTLLIVTAVYFLFVAGVTAFLYN